jgi:hypothetical protein
MDIRYPIGKFAWTAGNTREQRASAIEEIAKTPSLLRASLAGFNDAQLDTPYREGGWTVRQVVHHLPDSHMNSYIRIKFALTENQPTIKPYDEVTWANLVDAKSAPIEPSLKLMDGLHARWEMLLRSLSETDVCRQFIHPEHGTLTVDQYISLCAWHGRHHVAHITALRERSGW